jgi:hypothetical protein
LWLLLVRPVVPLIIGIHAARGPQTWPYS